MCLCEHTSDWHEFTSSWLEFAARVRGTSSWHEFAARVRGTSSWHEFVARVRGTSSRSTVFVCEMDLELEFLLVFEFKRATLVPSPLQSTLALRTRASSPPANRIKEWLKQTPTIKDSRYYCFFFSRHPDSHNIESDIERRYDKGK